MGFLGGHAPASSAAYLERQLAKITTGCASEKAMTNADGNLLWRETACDFSSRREG